MITWVSAQFERWGVWLQNNRGVGEGGQMAAWLKVGRGGNSGPAVPNISIECSRVHDWVAGLDDVSRATMVQVYCTAQSSVEHARVLGVSTRTLYARLHSLQVAYTRRHDEPISTPQKQGVVAKKQF